MFIRTGQKRKGEVSSNALQQLRDELLRRLQKIISASPEGQLPDSLVVQASALLRLYCALRGIAAIKFVFSVSFSSIVVNFLFFSGFKTKR